MGQLAKILPLIRVGFIDNAHEIFLFGSGQGVPSPGRESVSILWKRRLTNRLAQRTSTL
jgi:hypothetical protein